MLIVCYKHVKDGLKGLDVPHVKKIKHYKCTCSFCNQEAEIKIFYPIPFLRGGRKNKSNLINSHENDRYYQYYK